MPARAVFTQSRDRLSSETFVDPIFTLQWPEFLLASGLQKKLPKTEGYSVLVPVSRQEKGIDLALLRKAHKRSRTITIQVKASKTYMPERPKR